MFPSILVFFFLGLTAIGTALTLRCLSLAGPGLLKRIWLLAVIFSLYIALLSSSYKGITFEIERSKWVIPTSGVMMAGAVPFGVYWDPTGTRPVTSIEWGNLWPGQTRNATFYVRNEGSSPIYCSASWNETSWKPANASRFFDMTWNFGGAPLAPSRARKVTLALHVHKDVWGVETFSFDIVISAQNEPY